MCGNVQGSTVRRAMFERRRHDPNPSLIITIIVVVSAFEPRISCCHGSRATIAAVGSRRLDQTATASSDSQLTWTIRHVIIEKQCINNNNRDPFVFFL